MASHNSNFPTQPAVSSTGRLQRSPRRFIRSLAGTALFAGSLLWCGLAAADEPHGSGDTTGWHDFIETYRWGISEYETDDFTKVTGWQLGSSWHFGYKEGKGSGLSLVWQGDEDQMSFSADGIRYTHRF